MNEIHLFNTIVNKVNIELEDGDIQIDDKEGLAYTKIKTKKWYFASNIEHYLMFISIENSFLSIILRKAEAHTRNNDDSIRLMYSNKIPPLKFLYIPMHRVISIQ